jgi:hypothetical protein
MAESQSRRAWLAEFEHVRKMLASVLPRFLVAAEKCGSGGVDSKGNPIRPSARKESVLLSNTLNALKEVLPLERQRVTLLTAFAESAAFESAAVVNKRVPRMSADTLVQDRTKKKSSSRDTKHIERDSRIADVMLHSVFKSPLQQLAFNNGILVRKCGIVRIHDIILPALPTFFTSCMCCCRCVMLWSTQHYRMRICRGKTYLLQSTLFLSTLSWYQRQMAHALPRPQNSLRICFDV